MDKSNIKKQDFIEIHLSDRESIFVEIIYDLLLLSDNEKRAVALDADVHWTTLYSWVSFRTRTPRIDTICRVAKALGYDVILRRKSTRVTSQLRVVQ